MVDGGRTPEGPVSRWSRVRTSRVHHVVATGRDGVAHCRWLRGGASQRSNSYEHCRCGDDDDRTAEVDRAVTSSKLTGQGSRPATGRGVSVPACGPGACRGIQNDKRPRGERGHYNCSGSVQGSSGAPYSSSRRGSLAVLGTPVEWALKFFFFLLLLLLLLLFVLFCLFVSFLKCVDCLHHTWCVLFILLHHVPLLLMQFEDVLKELCACHCCKLCEGPSDQVNDAQCVVATRLQQLLTSFSEMKDVG